MVFIEKLSFCCRLKGIFSTNTEKLGEHYKLVQNGYLSRKQKAKGITIIIFYFTVKVTKAIEISKIFSNFYFKLISCIRKKLDLL